MRIVVTGGAGYIGSHAVRALVEKGEEVIVLDNLITGREELVWSGAEFVKIDLREREDLEKWFRGRRVGAVMHFAALSEVGESVEEPEKYWENNFEGTKNLLSAMKGGGVDRLVFSSTAAVYGEPERVPIMEEDEKSPVNPYGESKLAAEREIIEMGKEFGLKAFILRYFNVAGASGDGRLGEMRKKETHLIPIVLRRAWEGKPVMIFGTDYETRDGTCVRDYVHVEDLVEGHLRALDYLMKQRSGGVEVCNLGSEKGVTVREVVEVCKRLMGKDIEVVEAERRPGDPAVLVARVEKANGVLGWRAERDLEKMVETSWGWFQKIWKKI